MEKGAIPATESEEQIRLRLSGLVVKDQGQLKPHNRIYAAVFDRAWAERILAELRPYAEAISIWLKSEGQDESRLLRGNALEEAQRWATNKHLGKQDVDFLMASEQAANRVSEEENRILGEANRRANRRLKMTAGLLGTAIAVAVGSGLWASYATVTAKNAEQEQRSAEAKTQEANEEANLAQNREKMATKNLETVRAQLISTSGLAKTAKEQEQQAKVNLKAARQELQTAKSDFQDAYNRLEIANQSGATAKQELAMVKEQFDDASDQVVEVNAKVEKAKAELETIRKELQHRQEEYSDMWDSLWEHRRKFQASERKRW